MKTLSNGLTVFNATPHPITFADGKDVVSVPCDTVINATPVECFVSSLQLNGVQVQDPLADYVTFVRTEFVGTDEGHEIINNAFAAGADVIVGSIIAAQAYPGKVVAMTPAPGFERVPPAEKRMNPNKFTTFF